MSLKAIDAAAAPVTKMDAFRLYALHKRFKITKSQKALDRLGNFQNLLVEKAIGAAVVSREGNGAVLLAFKSEISRNLICLDVGRDEFFKFKKDAHSRVSLLFTKQSKLPLVSVDSPAPLFESDIDDRAGNLAKYQKLLHTLKQQEKYGMNVRLIGTGLCVATGIAGVAVIAPGLPALFAAGSLAWGVFFSASVLLSLAVATIVPAKTLSGVFSELANRISEAVAQVALEGSFKKP